MDSFEFNKIAGAVLATALGIMALSIVSEMIFHPAEAEQPGLVVAVAEPAAGGEGGGTAVAEVEPIAVRLAAANIAAGEQSAGKCKSCHTFDKGDPRKTPGPNLWGVVGGPAAHLDTFPSYSDAMEAEHAEGMTWTFENLDHFLTAPKAFIPGTAMTFAGLKKPDERANVIAYLRTLSDNPVPLPDATAAAPAATEAAPATEAPAAAATEAPAAAQPPTAAEPAPAPSPEPPAVQTPPESPAVEPAPAAPPAAPAP